MADIDLPPSRTFQVYCRVEVVVTDAQALTGHAVAELTAADIDWSEEDDDLPSAIAELRADPAAALDSVVDIGALVDGVPGVEALRGRSWVEAGPPDDPDPGRW
ncbi:hypothetical protein [Micromonospora psammae]|uniref:hypothetical protein n=1 Tax=Micromonospora sp. CPCC 205556 TaxID=3122398 RepID=UPI002FF0C1EF